jgi:predicted metal-dependent hydrolase
VPAIVAQKRGWIDKAQRKLAAQAVVTREPEDYPDWLELHGIGERWQVQYRPSAGGAGALQLHMYPHQQLILTGPTQNWLGCQSLLQRWVAGRAKMYLLPLLRQVSDETGLAYRSGTVRSPRTRWGSCSNEQTISLNSKLLFLPLAQVRYVIVHELCHTVHFDHSPEFWRLVGRHDLNYVQHKADLKVADRWLPAWLPR